MTIGEWDFYLDQALLPPQTAPGGGHGAEAGWREKDHNDLILSLAIASCVGENRNAQTHAVARFMSYGGRK